MVVGDEGPSSVVKVVDGVVVFRGSYRKRANYEFGLFFFEVASRVEHLPPSPPSLPPPLPPKHASRPQPDAGLVETLKGCLTRDPSARLPIAGRGGLLSHAYLHPVATTSKCSFDV